MKKIIVSIVVMGCLLITPILPVYALNYSQKSEEINSVTIKNNDNIDRWAVIIGLGKYQFFESGAWCPELAINAHELYYLLQDKDSRWNANNMQLLINETATKQNILNALDWLKENADEGDIVLFSFGGHGNRQDGVSFITTYDSYVDSFDNDISADVLDSKFDEINNKNVKGMFLIFDCCYSGGFIDWNRLMNNIDSLSAEEMTQVLDMYIQESNTDTTGTLSTEESLTNEQILNILGQLPQESASVTTELKSDKELLTTEEIVEELNAAMQDINGFTTGLMEAIGVDNKVVLASTHPKAYGTMWNGITFTQGVRTAIEEGKTTAEDISIFAKWFWLYIYYVDNGILPRWFGLIMLTMLILFPFLHNLGTLPMWKDGYPADNPLSAKLSIIGDGQGGSQSQPQVNPSAQNQQSNQLLIQMMTKPTNR